MFTVADTVENKAGEAVTLFPDSSVSRIGTPKTSGYSVLHEGFIGVIGADQPSTELTYAAIAKETNNAKILPVDRISRRAAGSVSPINIGPPPSFPPRTKNTRAGSANSRGSPAISDRRLRPSPRRIAPGASMQMSTRIFAGAKETAVLNKYQNEQGVTKLDMLIDWACSISSPGRCSGCWRSIHKYLGNFGLSILAITVIVKSVFFPLANKSYLSMAKMKAMQPKMKELQEKFADDKTKQQQEIMELYSAEKINPVAGCLPMLLQIPVFFSLYKVLFVTIEMRQAPFFGWIKDLSAPDPTNVFNLFGLIPFDPTQLPMFGYFLHLGIWPLIMGVSMWVQMKMNPEPTDPVQKTMFAWMPVIFTFMLGAFPAGLVIYWTWNNLLSVAAADLHHA